MAFSVNDIRARVNRYARRRAAYVQTRDELEALSKRELDDLGIAPADIPAIARSEAAKF